MAHTIGEVINVHGSTLTTIEKDSGKRVNHNTTALKKSSSQNAKKKVVVMGSRRIFSASFKLKVLDSYRNDIDCRGNQRATARKYSIHRRQIQKWLQCEDNLRSSCAETNTTTTVTSTGCCTVPVGSDVATSPAISADAQGEITNKADVTTTASLSGSISSINSNSNGSNNNNNNNNNDAASIGVAGSVGTPIETPVPATLMPALNFRLARLHGDEQLHQLAVHRRTPPHLPPSRPPSASLRHPGQGASSPTSLQYHQHSHNSHHHHAVRPHSPNSLPLRNTLFGYTEYGSQQEALQRNHQRHHRRQHPNEHQIHDEEQQQQRGKLIKDPSSSSETKYSYVINCTTANYDGQRINATGSSRSPNPEPYYQTLESYQTSTGFVDSRASNDNNNAKEIGFIGGASPSYQDKSNVVSTGSVSAPPPPPPPPPPSTRPTSFASSSSPMLLLHATTIKSERASPDSVATSGPCETPGSPESAASMPRARLNHSHNYHQLGQQHRQQSPPQRLTGTSADTLKTTRFDVCTTATNTRNNLVNRASAAATAAAAIATASTAAVHSNETTSPLPHVHVSVDSHAPNTRDSEKQLQEREQMLHQGSVKVEYEERMGRRVKEEIVEREEVGTTTSTGSTTTPMTMIMTSTATMREPKREISDEDALIECSRYHRQRTTADVAGPCPDYQGAPAVSAQTPMHLSSGSCAGLVCPPIRDSAGSFSGLSSPRTASSSGISTSSYSDSEIDALDYSSSSAKTAVVDLSRRRSFSLRFKLEVLDAFHGDPEVAGNQRATARKFEINRRQVQKWLGQESELRGEIALRGGDLRQRLGPITENTILETSNPVDLRTCPATNYPVAAMRSAAELEHSSSPLYYCDIRSSPQNFVYYHQGSIAQSPEIQPRTCTMSCCVDGPAPAPTSCYQESANHRRSSIGYPESQNTLYCYSPRDPLEIGPGHEALDVTMSSRTLKRSACSLSCCYEPPSPPKRPYHESLEEPQASPVCQDFPPQDAPLCLVKPKSFARGSPTHSEPVTSTVPTPPAQVVVPPAPTPASKKNAILFKPYLDNPVSKPSDEIQLNHQANHREPSPLGAQSVIVNNNNNCHGTCKMNEERSLVSNTQHDYALELSLRVPVTWQTHHGGYSEFPERLRSAFVRYPTSPHYT